MMDAKKHIPRQYKAGIRYDEHKTFLKSMESIGGQKMAYLDIGPKNGEVVLLIHGIPTSSWMYREIIATLSKQFRVVAPEMIGFGQSARPKQWDEYSIHTQARRVVQLMDYLEVPNWTHVFHDQGASWTGELLGIASERIKRIVVLNSTMYKDGWNPPAEILRVSRMGKGMVNFVSKVLTNPLFGKVVFNSSFKDYVAKKDLYTKEINKGYFEAVSQKQGMRGWRYFVSNIEEIIANLPRYAANLRVLEVPSMIIWGAKDKVFDVNKLPTQFAQDLKTKESDIHILADENHFLQEGASKKISSLITEFLLR